MNYAVILAGGAGTRLWPLSREGLSKPALKLYSDQSMFQITVERILPIFPPEHIFIVSGAEGAQILAGQVPAIPRENFLIEPVGRNTAPAIALAAIHLQARDADASMAVLTADHYIGEPATFCRALSAGLEMATRGFLVTLGIKPTYPSTEYGYIEQDESLGEVGGFPVYRAERFVEKPNAGRAQTMLSVGGYVWNSGMFVWQVARLLTEIERQMPNLYETIMRIAIHIGQKDYEAVLSASWPGLVKQSIDYGIMEHARQVAVIPVEMEWKDIGSWSSLKSLMGEDAGGNSLRGEVLLRHSSGNLVLGDGRLIAGIGLQDLIVVDTRDALLICQKDQEGELRKLVAELKESGHADLL